MHIILYSDNAKVQSVVKTQLAEIDRLSICDSAMELLAAAKALAADAVILDLGTHGLSGSLLATALRELAPGVPVLAVSTTAGTDTVSAVQQGIPHLALAAGCDAELRALITEITGRRRGTLTAVSE